MKTEFVLKFPIEISGAKVTALSGRRPNVRDLRNFIKNLEKDSVMAMQLVLADLFQVPEATVGMLDIEDYAPMQKWFQDFLAPMKNDSED